MGRSTRKWTPETCTTEEMDFMRRLRHRFHNGRIDTKGPFVVSQVPPRN